MMFVYEVFVKFVAAIRLVLATSLIILFSGTIAFAHEGYHHGAQLPQAAKTSVSAIPARGSAVPATHFSEPELAGKHNGAIVTLTSAPSSCSDCDHGCCCCGGGASTCGMSGCSALGLSTAEGFVPRAMNSDKLIFNIADVRSGRNVFGLDRPPKV